MLHEVKCFYFKLSSCTQKTPLFIKWSRFFVTLLFVRSFRYFIFQCKATAFYYIRIIYILCICESWNRPDSTTECIDNCSCSMLFNKPNYHHYVQKFKRDDGRQTQVMIWYGVPFHLCHCRNDAISTFQNNRQSAIDTDDQCKMQEKKWNSTAPVNFPTVNEKWM